MDIAKDLEIFGPVVPIIGFDTPEEAVEIANASRYGLSGCVYTKDWKLGMQMARAIQSGGVVVNGVGAVSYTHLDVYKRQDTDYPDKDWSEATGAK